MCLCDASNPGGPFFFFFYHCMKSVATQLQKSFVVTRNPCRDLESAQLCSSLSGISTPPTLFQNTINSIQ